jgi:hypothetical protein
VRGAEAGNHRGDYAVKYQISKAIKLIQDAKFALSPLKPIEHDGVRVELIFAENSINDALLHLKAAREMEGNK